MRSITVIFLVIAVGISTMTMVVDFASAAAVKFAPSAACNNRNRTSCDATPICFWNPLGFCQRGCGMYNQYQCNMFPDVCTWDPTGLVCTQNVTGCRALSERADCEKYKDACVWAPLSTGGAGCRSNCYVTHTTERDCANDWHCVWDQFDQVCRGSCAMTYANAESCNKHSHGACQWATSPPSDVPSPCVPNCRNMYETMMKCNADRDCIWDSTDFLCGLDCRFYSGPNGKGQCDSVPNLCMWNAPLQVCQRDCSINDLTQCRYRADCHWSFTTGKCESSGVTGCLSLMSQDQCNHYSDRCKWQTINGIPQCKALCDLQTTETTCSATPLCWWNAVTSKCTTHCGDQYLTKAACAYGSSNNCAWVSSEVIYYVERCAHNCTVYNQQDCYTVGTSECVFDSTSKKCIPACSNYFFAADCDQHSSACIFDDQVGLCVTSCNIYNGDQQRCRSAVSCKWLSNTSSCANAVTGCPAVTSKSRCELLPSFCQWKIINGIPQCAPLSPPSPPSSSSPSPARNRQPLELFSEKKMRKGRK